MDEAAATIAIVYPHMNNIDGNGFWGDLSAWKIVASVSIAIFFSQVTLKSCFRDRSVNP